MNQPVLESDRVRLRPFVEEDAARVQSLAGDYAIADTTLNIPHPYEEGMAEQWIGGHRELFEAVTHVIYAVTDKANSELLGTVGLTIERRFNKANLGYWIGKPYWGRGFATEAAGVVVAYGFRELGLHRVASMHIVRNPASGRVMQKLGMQYEGTLRGDTMKWDRYEDLCMYGLLADEWKARDGASA